MKKIKRFRAFLTGVCVTASAIASPALPFVSQKVSAAEDYGNFAKALQYSMYFYDANMCGTDVGENTRYTWRGDCHTYDAELVLDTENTNLSADFISNYKSVLDPDGDGCADVSGGYHDAGDHVKFGLPEAYTASTLGWGYYEFRDSYVKTGQDDHIETILRYVNDYFMRCTFRDENGDVVAFCYQVGDGDIDHSFWNAPEIDSMDRKGWFATASNPSTDCVANTAGSLAANYLNFRDTDPSYAAECLDYSKALFRFAETNSKEVCPAEEGPKGYYTSSKYEDDYCWGAMWLYMATGEDHYLEEALGLLGNDYYAPPTYVHCWNDVWTGTLCLIAACNDQENGRLLDMYRTLSGKNEYEITDFWSTIEKQVQNAMSGSLGLLTPQGYLFINEWGSARYNTAAQLAALVYDKYNGGKPTKYSDWAKGQMEYLLGKNNDSKAYVVGYNENAVKYPHHRAASGLSKCEDTGEHKHVLYGALVGGPGENDEHIDKTSDYTYNEVTIDYNAAFVGACAGLYSFYGDDTMTVTPDFPPPDKNSGGEDGGNNYWVEGFYTDNLQSDGKGSINLTFFVGTDSVQACKDISIRFYFSAAGMSDIPGMKVMEIYDQTETETDFDGVLTGPTLYKDDIYYIEVKWDGYPIANSNKKYQILIGSWSDKWDITDDWSMQGIMKSDSDLYAGTLEKCPNVCVYSDGVLVGGTEPDGTTPGNTGIKGDINGDGKVSVPDIVMLNKYLTHAAQKVTNSSAADVNEDGSVNAFDAVSLKRILLS
ncbi:MAG: glycoside hydrolase family 9 protein [Porcipelethomonas sp.]